MARWEYLYFTDAEKETSRLHPPGHKEKLNELGNDSRANMNVTGNYQNFNPKEAETKRG